MTLTRRPSWRGDWRKRNRRGRFVRTSGVGGYSTLVLQRREEEEEEMRRLQAEAEAEAKAKREAAEAEAEAEAERIRQEEEEQLVWTVEPSHSVRYFIRPSLFPGRSTKGRKH